MALVYKITEYLFKSRKIILEMLEDRGYDISEYQNFTKDDIGNMLSDFNKNKESHELGTLDILVKNKDKKKIYVKYNLDKFKQSKSITKLINDIYENILSNSDTLIFINSGRILLKNPKDNKVEEYNNINFKKKHFVQFFGIENLLFNVSKHETVPQHTILSNKEIKNMISHYNITKEKQISLIRREDPMAKYIGMRPGNVCKIIYPSKNSILYTKYRLCVP